VPAFSGTRTFRKSFIGQYGLAIALIFFCLFFIWLAFENPKYQLGSFLAIGFFILVMIATLFQVNVVKVEANRLTIETVFMQKKFSARQIREIRMQSVRGRYGRVTHHVLLVTTEGKNYPLEGFSDGADILYGFLTSWWNAYKNR
jgi:hypothetical protein